LSGLVHANSVLKDSSIQMMIKNLEEFIHTQLTNEQSELGHVYKNNQLYIDGLLEDYAFVIQANLDLYSYYGNSAYLTNAKSYTLTALDLFYDTDENLFRAHTENPHLIIDHYDIEDNVIPSSNAIMANNLLLLNSIEYNSHFYNIAQHMLNTTLAGINYGSIYSHWLLAYMKNTSSFKLIKLKGKDLNDSLSYLKNHYIPNSFFIYKTTEELQKIEVCTNNKCMYIEDFNELLNILSIK